MEYLNPSQPPISHRPPGRSPWTPRTNVRFSDFVPDCVVPQILLGSLDPGAASRLALSDFLLAVTGLGTKLCPAVTVQESFDTAVRTLWCRAQIRVHPCKGKWGDGPLRRLSLETQDCTLRRTRCGAEIHQPKRSQNLRSGPKRKHKAK